MISITHWVSAFTTALAVMACSDVPGLSTPPESGGTTGVVQGGSPSSAGQGGSSGAPGGVPSSAGARASAGAGAASAGAASAGAASAGAASAGAAGNAEQPTPDVRPWRPASGKTYLLIGQSGARALTEYQSTVKSAVAGGSVYGDLYHGALNNETQLAFVDLLAAQQPGAFVELGLSWKDALAAQGYVRIDGGQPANFRTVTIEEDIVHGKFDPQIDAIGSLIKARPALKFLLRRRAG